MHSTGLPVAAYLDAHAVVIHVIPPALRGKKSAAIYNSMCQCPWRNYSHSWFQAAGVTSLPVELGRHAQCRTLRQHFHGEDTVVANDPKSRGNSNT